MHDDPITEDLAEEATTELAYLTRCAVRRLLPAVVEPTRQREVAVVAALMAELDGVATCPSAGTPAPGERR